VRQDDKHYRGTFSVDEVGSSVGTSACFPKCNLFWSGSDSAWIPEIKDQISLEDFPVDVTRRYLPSVPAMLALSGLAALSFFLTGCGGMGTAASPAVTVPNVTIHGTVFGGQQPVSLATITIYQVGTTGYGSAGTSILNVVPPTTITSDSNGNFTYTGTYTCPTPTTQVYFVATGGNPGLAMGTNNAALALMSAIGNCQDIATLGSLDINELSTVASVYALAQFMGDGTIPNGGTMVGASAGNAAGLAAAMATVKTLVYLPGGHVPGHGLPSGTAVPTTELNTLGDIIASCVNSTGLTGECTSLFSATTVPAGLSTFTPTNTIDAMLEIALHPGNNVGTLYNLALANAPWQPILANPGPNDWTVDVKYTDPTLRSPNGLSIDASGNIWTANTGDSSSTEFSNVGATLGSIPGTTSGLDIPHYNAISGSGNVWFANNAVGANSLSAFNSAGIPLGFSPVTGGGLNTPSGIAIDASGNVWAANETANVISEFNATGVDQTGGSGFNALGMVTPIALAVDGSANVWTASFGDSLLIEFNSSGTEINVTGGGGVDLPNSVGIDNSNSVWVTNQDGPLSKFDSGGTDQSTGSGFTGGGLDGPTEVAIDGLGRAWVSSEGTGSSTGAISEFDTSGNALSPSVGFASGGVVNTAQFLAIDFSGNIWVPNLGDSTLTEMIGLAAPVITPLAAALPSNLGARP
jgi:hypothetical protein